MMRNFSFIVVDFSIVNRKKGKKLINLAGGKKMGLSEAIKNANLRIRA